MSTPGVSNFPTALDDAVSLIEYANNASATLTSGISSSALLIPVSAPSEFSDSGVVTIVDSLTNPTVIEIVLYTSKSGSDLVVPAGGRGAQGTTPSAFNSGAVVEQRPTARGFTVLADAIIQMQEKLQAGDFRAVNGMFSNIDDGDSINNTTTETSLFTGAGASSGSSRTIAANSAVAGAVYRLRVEGAYSTTGTPTLRFRIKLGAGGTLIGDTTAFNATTGTGAGRFFIDAYIFVDAIGASGSVRVELRGNLMPTNSGTATPVFFVGSVGSVTIDFTAAQIIDVTAEWGTASASNAIALIHASVERVR